MSKHRAVVLVRGEEARVYGLGKEDAVAEAQYWFKRRWEKDGWQADKVYIAEQLPDETVQKWVDAEVRRSARYDREMREREELAEYERLKAKFGAAG